MRGTLGGVDEVRAAGAVGDAHTAMTPRLAWPAALFARRFFDRFALDEGEVKLLRDMEERGAVLYVMRYSSRLDYLLFNWLFLGAGLRLSGAANGIWFDYYRPLRESVPLLLRRLVRRLRRGSRGVREQGRRNLRAVLNAGGSAFLFLRTDKIPSAALPRRRALRSARREHDYLAGIIDGCFDEYEGPVALVPLALFWRKGPTAQRGFLDLFYGGPERPRSWVKLLSFLLNYRNLTVRVGTPVDLRAVVERRRHEGRERVARRVRRVVMIFLRREEKAVVGPALRTPDRVEEAVLADPAVRAAIEAAGSAPGAVLRARGTAARHLREIAARPSSVMLAGLAIVVRRIFRRLFTRFEVEGLAEVIDAVKLHPVVLVPSHRSHFDYVILSYLFYERNVVPPLVAAGSNLSFWPLGPMFRRGGAFFLRRSFEGDRLYAAVFGAYVRLLIKDGATQEFFIEGTRSRTGKTLQPRLGLLRMVLDAYASGVRRELYLVPVGFTYERLVEEGAMAQERRGLAKRGENLWNLLRARSVFGYRFGGVTVRFGSPIAMSRVLESARAGSDAAGSEPDLRVVAAGLGVELSRRINAQITATRSAVASAALLSTPGPALRVAAFDARVRETVALLDLLEAPVDASLRRCLEGDRPDAAAAMLVVAGQVRRRSSPRADYLEIEPEHRGALDYYRAALTPVLVWPAALALALREPVPASELGAHAGRWLDVLELEYFPLRGEARERRLATLCDHMRARGWIGRGGDGAWRVTPDGGPWIGFWAAQIRPVLEAYRATLDAVRAAGARGGRRALIEAAQAVHREQLALGEAVYPEGVCPVACGNALDWLVSCGVLERTGARGEAELGPGPARERLAELEATLSAALD